ncbi:MAG: aspartate aminotransferase family protein [Polyangiaceae bacterium]|nr:aspartate aminotransferase family protein [Polyangiaceae bacterium]
MDAQPESLTNMLTHGFAEFRDFVNPLIASRAALSREPVDFHHVRGGLLVGADGAVFEDFHGVQAFGHRRAEVSRAVAEFLASDAPNWFPSRVNPFTGRLARRLCEHAGGAYDRVYLTCTGSEAVEAALKLARAATGRPRIVGVERAYHGCGMGSMGLMHDGPFRDPFGPHLPGITRIPFGDAAALRRELAPGDVAAVIVEPIQGEGGVHALPAAFVEAACSETRAHGALLIADEVQSGLGRAGRFLTSETWPRRPDAVVLGKQLGGGLMAVAAMLTTEAHFMRAYGEDFEDGESHNVTLGQNGASAVAALATLSLLTEPVLSRARAAGERLRKALREALAGNSLLDEVRGEGLLLGIALHQPEHPWLSFEHWGLPKLAARATIAPILAYRLYKHGFFTFACGHDWRVLRVQPRLDVDDATLDRFVKAVAQELAHIAEWVS